MISLALSPSQSAIADSAAQFLAKVLPLTRVRELAASPLDDAIDDATWRRCAEMGWLGLSVAEEDGGAGLGLAEEAMIFRELGRRVAPGPFRSSVLGARVASRSGRGDIAVAITTGQRRVGMQVGEFAVDARPTDLLLKLDEDGAELLDVVAVEHMNGLDPGTRLVRVTEGQSIVRLDDAGLISRAHVLAAAEMLGIIEAVRDMSASYAQTRVQFGRPIGSFQAVKHRCADMAIAAYATVGQVFQAALLVDADAPDAALHAAAAYVLAVSGARASAADNIQNHGAIGFTWEHDAHLFLKRVCLLERLFGPQRNAYRTILSPVRHEF